MPLVSTMKIESDMQYGYDCIYECLTENFFPLPKFQPLFRLWRTNFFNLAMTACHIENYTDEQFTTTLVPVSVIAAYMRTMEWYILCGVELRKTWVVSFAERYMKNADPDIIRRFDTFKPYELPLVFDSSEVEVRPDYDGNEQYENLGPDATFTWITSFCKHILTIRKMYGPIENIVAHRQALDNEIALMHDLGGGDANIENILNRPNHKPDFIDNQTNFQQFLIYSKIELDKEIVRRLRQSKDHGDTGYMKAQVALKHICEKFCFSNEFFKIATDVLTMYYQEYHHLDGFFATNYLTVPAASLLIAINQAGGAKTAAHQPACALWWAHCTATLEDLTKLSEMINLPHRSVLATKFSCPPRCDLGNQAPPDIAHAQKLRLANEFDKTPGMKSPGLWGVTWNGSFGSKKWRRTRRHETIASQNYYNLDGNFCWLLHRFDNRHQLTDHLQVAVANLYKRYSFLRDEPKEFTLNYLKQTDQRAVSIIEKDIDILHNMLPNDFAMRDDDDKKAELFQTIQEDLPNARQDGKGRKRPEKALKQTASQKSTGEGKKKGGKKKTKDGEEDLTLTRTASARKIVISDDAQHNIKFDKTEQSAGETTSPTFSLNADKNNSLPETTTETEAVEAEGENRSSSSSSATTTSESDDTREE